MWQTSNGQTKREKRDERTKERQKTSQRSGSRWMVARLALVGEKEEEEGGAMVRYMGVTKSIDKKRAKEG